MPGKGVTSDPVAIKMFLVLMTWAAELSPLVTATSLGDTIEPKP